MESPVEVLAVVSWPRSLPQEWFSQEAPPAYAPVDNTIRTQNSAGPNKLRRKFTAQVENITLTRELSESEIAILEDFVKVKLGEVNRFMWVNFTTGRPAEYRFVAGWSSVKRTFFGGDVWTVALTLEMMP